MGSNPGYNRPFCGSLLSLVSSGISIFTCHHPNAAVQPNQQQAVDVFTFLLVVNCFANNGQQHQRKLRIDNRFVTWASDVEAAVHTGEPIKLIQN